MTKMMGCPTNDRDDGVPTNDRDKDAPEITEITMPHK